MIPEGLLEIGILLELGVLGLHLSDDGLGALQTFFLGRKLAGILHHLLNLPSILGHNQLLTLCVVI
jgi:hypothetical protein